ncbi:FecR domain-containing protein [bacterium]|nr:FecR domain-containing protein [bacterium]
MKNYFIILFLLLFLAVHSAFAQQAIVLLSEGKVEISKKGKNSWENCPKGTPVFFGDKIKTGTKGVSKVLFLDDQSVVKIRPNTELEFSGEKKNNKISKDVFMSSGEALIKVIKGKDADFKVSTPTSVASVKGTEFWTIVFPDGSTKIVGLEGLVELLNKISGKVVNVSINQTGLSEKNGSLASSPTKNTDTPIFEGDTSGGKGQIKVLRIKFLDKQGNERTLKIEYEEK